MPTLKQDLDPVSARWDKSKDTWIVERKTKYCWVDMKEEPISDWFYELKDALDWIVKHDISKVVTRL